jgi:protein-S-isoprenylcysteine O-methyltransferase Ste14
MKNKLYSYILVSLQFISIALLLVFNESVFFKTMPLLFFGFGFGVGLYALWCNKLTNINIIPEIKEGAQMITTGAYKYIRHPMYFSVLLMMLGVVISALKPLNFTLYLVLIFVLFLKAKKEETLWLEKSKFYAPYMENTKRIIPFIL